LTRQANPRNALEAMLAVSHAPPPAGRVANCRGGLGAPAPPRAKVAVDRAAAGLLARILAYRPAQGPPIILLVGCAATQRPSIVAAVLSHACAVLVGRTLMVEIDQQSSGLLSPLPTRGPLPDAFLAGLYHYRIGSSAADVDLLYGPARAQALATLAGPFRILVIESPGTCGGASLALAPVCSCTVLVVQAGRTEIGAIQAAAAAVSEAGGRLVGTVLDGVTRSHVARKFAH
jgi:hypothetical protein